VKPLILVGGGGHCRAVIDVIEAQEAYEIVGILDKQTAVGAEVAGYPVVGDDSALAEWARKGVWFLVTVGQVGPAGTRRRLFEAVRVYTDRFATVISPLAYVSGRATIARGCVVMHHALVNAGAVVGCNAIVNSKALVEHDAVIQKHVHVATGALVNGGALVGEGSFVGSGAVVVQAARVPPETFVKAGSVYKGESHG